MLPGLMAPREARTADWLRKECGKLKELRQLKGEGHWWNGLGKGWKRVLGDR